jgi:hypothetical protein
MATVEVVTTRGPIPEPLATMKMNTKEPAQSRRIMRPLAQRERGDTQRR